MPCAGVDDPSAAPWRGLSLSCPEIGAFSGTLQPIAWHLRHRAFMSKKDYMNTTRYKSKKETDMHESIKIYIYLYVFLALVTQQASRSLGVRYILFWDGSVREQLLLG